MAASVEVICNKALSRLGIRQRITTLATDAANGMAEAVACNDWYATARDLVLADFDWPFARVKADLSAATGEAAWDGWAYIHVLPSSPVLVSPLFLLPKGVPPRKLTSSMREPFQIVKSSQNDSMIVLSDQPTPTLYYTAQITDTTKFAVDFEDAVVWRLAMEICVPLNADMKKGDYARQRYEKSVADVIAGVWNSYQSEDEEPEGESITARS